MNMNMKFIANINLNYPNSYKKLPTFYRVCCTNTIYTHLFSKIKTKGFNARNSFFIFPEISLPFNAYLEILEKKVDGDLLSLNGIIINNRLINIYNNLFSTIMKNKQLGLASINQSILNVLSLLHQINIILFSFINNAFLIFMKHKVT